MIAKGEVTLPDEENNGVFYYLDVEGYFGMSITVAEHFKISPKEIYDTWSLPMLIVTYVKIHNDKLNDYERERIESKKKKHTELDVKTLFIPNITAEMMSEDVVEEKSQFSDEHMALLEMYK